MGSVLAREVVVVDACRTPIGRLRGRLADVRPDDLTAIIIQALLRRTPELSPDDIDDVFWGGANQAGEDNRNVARMGVLLSGLPVEIPGVTLNRLCGSGLQAVISAAHAIAAGEADTCLAGGVESMTRAPFVVPRATEAFQRKPEMHDTRLGWRMVNPLMEERYPPISLGETAEEVAARYGVSREAQDAHAARSHERALAAQRAGRFDAELVPVTLPDGEIVEADEAPRADSTPEQLGALRPAFRAGGSVTAGNSSPLNDGAAGLVLMSGERARALGIKPLGRIIASAAAGVHPDIMGIGPVPAVRKVLRRAAMTLDDVDLVEINEAFAAQTVASIDELGLDVDRVNVNGGAIALGHPLGCSGARIVTTLLHELRRRGGGRGLATLCIAVGQGLALLVEVDA